MTQDLFSFDDCKAEEDKEEDHENETKTGTMTRSTSGALASRRVVRTSMTILTITTSTPLFYFHSLYYF